MYLPNQRLEHEFRLVTFAMVRAIPGITGHGSTLRVYSAFLDLSLTSRHIALMTQGYGTAPTYYMFEVATLTESD